MIKPADHLNSHSHFEKFCSGSFCSATVLESSFCRFGKLKVKDNLTHGRKKSDRMFLRSGHQTRQDRKQQCYNHPITEIQNSTKNSNQRYSGFPLPSTKWVAEVQFRGESESESESNVCKREGSGGCGDN